MSNQITKMKNAHNAEMVRKEKIKLRKHLNADTLFSTMRKGVASIENTRTGNGKHSLCDALMSGFAMFSLKDPSLLAFDERRYGALSHNLITIYGISTIPCDISMREILDVVDPIDLRPLFKDAFRAMQHVKTIVFYINRFRQMIIGGSVTTGKCLAEFLILSIRKHLLEKKKSANYSPEILFGTFTVSCAGNVISVED